MINLNRSLSINYWIISPSLSADKLVLPHTSRPHKMFVLFTTTHSLHTESESRSSKEHSGEMTPQGGESGIPTFRRPRWWRDLLTYACWWLNLRLFNKKKWHFLYFFSKCLSIRLIFTRLRYQIWNILVQLNWFTLKCVILFSFVSGQCLQHCQAE